MTLKDVQLDMAENLPEEIREKYGLEDTGMVAIETINPNLRVEIKHINDINKYFLDSGKFLEE